MLPRILILGAGFGGLELSTSLSEAMGEAVDITLIDKSDGFVFGFAKLDLLAKLEALSVPAGAINGIDEVFADPHVQARGMRVDLTLPEAEAGSVPSVRSPIVIDGVPQFSSRPSPILGQHTAEVLADPNWKKA